MAEETWLKSLINKRVKITLPSGNEQFGVLETVEADAIIVDKIWMNKAYLASVEAAQQTEETKTTSITDATYRQHLHRESD